MAVQTLNLNPPPALISASSPNVANLNNTSNNRNNNDKVGYSNIQDQLNGTSNYKADNNDSTDVVSDKDKVTLSADAQQALNGNLPSVGNHDTFNFNENSLDNQAIQFRGLSQIAVNRPLTVDETDQVKSIRDNFSKIGIGSDKEILKTADKKLADLQTQATNLVQSLQSGDITGSQYQQLNQINKVLNKSNGFGTESVDNTQQNQLNTLNKQVSSITQQAPDQKLSNDTINNLNNLQQQVSSIAGYRLNVSDSIGPNGILV